MFKMTAKTKKIIWVTIAIIAGASAIGFGIYYYILVKAYSTILNATDADKLINNSTSDVSDDDIIDDETTANADASKGVQAGSNTIDAVQIQNMTWLYNNNTGLYDASDNSGDTYNDTNKVITYEIDGSLSIVDPNQVIYGTYDNTNQFIAN